MEPEQPKHGTGGTEKYKFKWQILEFIFSKRLKIPNGKTLTSPWLLFCRENYYYALVNTRFCKVVL